VLFCHNNVNKSEKEKAKINKCFIILYVIIIVRGQCPRQHKILEKEMPENNRVMKKSIFQTGILSGATYTLIQI